MMLDTIRRFIEENNMILPEDTIVVGVSGGADSVCLLLVLKELQSRIHFRLIAVHVNHCIRGEEADRDQEFVNALCRQNEVMYLPYQVDVISLSNQEKISVEEAGRKARYHIFEQVLLSYASEKTGKIAVAHHMDDQAETILMNLFRGSGMKGICGMQPVRGNIIRPLLCVRRKQIEQFLADIRQDYRTDSTNLHNDYTRNRLRNEVLPYVQSHINESSVENIYNMAQMASETQAYIENEAFSAKNKCVSINNDNSHIINIRTFSQYNVVIKKHIIREVLCEICGQLKEIYKVHIESILKLVEMQVGSQVDLSYGMVAKRGYQEIMIYLKSEDQSMARMEPINLMNKTEVIPLDNTFYFKLIGFKMIHQINFQVFTKIEKIIGNDYTKMFDYDKINFTLQLRTRQTGDFIYINEQSGTKKLKDFFIDNKIPKEYRDRVLLLADGNSIVWIFGFRMSEYYKITKNTKHFLQVSVN